MHWQPLGFRRLRPVPTCPCASSSRDPQADAPVSIGDVSCGAAGRAVESRPIPDGPAFLVRVDGARPEPIRSRLDGQGRPA
jgi:hypothetical protein